jgi:CRP/FNR family transcriptional regulator, cyclic AMP receptor protein
MRAFWHYHSFFEELMDDLDFSKPAGAPKPAPVSQPQPQAPLYLPGIARAFFESVGKEESVASGTVFFAENEKASRILLKRDKMYLLVEGQVALTAKGKPLGAVKVGHIFGEMAAISDSPRSATAVAKSDCRVLSLDDKQFIAALQKKPEFALMMLGTMIVRLREMLSRVSGIPSASEKESRVFDKKLLASLHAGLGEQNVVRYEKGKVIMVAGQTGALMYVVLEGRVAISIRGAVIERVGPGGVFGEMALVDQSPRAANAAAETDCALLAINRPVFLNLVKSEPTFGISLLSSMAERLRNTAAGLT